MADMKRMFSVSVGVRYTGFCYDGPYEGAWHDSETPMMCLYSQDPLWWHNMKIGNPPSCVVHAHQIYYRWSDPLKKWVCLNMR